MQVKNIHVNTVIVGGGIVGCWLLNALRKQGVEAVLLESNALGAGQTGASQGIIHGGVKYALNGLLNKSSQSIADMPAAWQAALKGEGEVDLSSAKVLSDGQYLWSAKNLRSRLKTFFASHLLHGRCDAVNQNELPAIFKNSAFKGSVYRLSETVLDVYSVLSALCEPYQQYCLKADRAHVSYKVSAGVLQSIDFAAGACVLRLSAENYLYTAGEGVEELISRSVIVPSLMQRRPLRMSMVRFDELQPLYAHCIGKTANPIITVTSHKNEKGEWVWYVGGEVAEKGAKLSDDAHEAALIKALKKCLPWQRFSNFKLKSFLINRAEQHTRDHSRPEKPYVRNFGKITIIWPTKLAFTPMLLSKVKPFLRDSEVAPHGLDHLTLWPKATVAKPIWNEV